MSGEETGDKPVTVDELVQIHRRLDEIAGRLEGNNPPATADDLNQLHHELVGMNGQLAKNDLTPMVDGLGRMEERLASVNERIAAFPSRDDIGQLRQSLGGIEGRLTAMENKPVKSDDWRPTIAVALIAGLFGLITVWAQAHYQDKTETAIKTLEANLSRSMKEDEAYGAAIGVARASFYQQSKSLLERIDTSFEEFCFLSVEAAAGESAPAGEKNQLTGALEEYRKHLANAPDGLDEETKAKLKNYSEFVANSQFKIRTENLNDEAKKTLYQNSKAMLKSAQDAIKESSRKRAFTAQASSPAS
jgi:hypothetical protein